MIDSKSRITAVQYIKKSFIFVVIFLLSQQLFSQPSISSFSPTVGQIGSAVTINGNNFDASPANNIVYFGAVKATVSSASATQLLVTVPSGATYQPITVTTNNLTAYSLRPFIVTFAGGSDAFTINSFAAKIDSAAQNYPRLVSIGDLDGDGKADLAISNYGSNTISVFRNTGIPGTISFAPKINYTTGTTPYRVIIGDIDGDGKPDIETISYNDNTVSIFKNTSTGPGNISFDPKIDLAAGINPCGIAIGDIDSDGKPDLAVTNQTYNTISVFKNTSVGGTISFNAKADYPGGGTSVAIADINNDGKPDLIGCSSGGSTISILRNTGNPGVISFSAKADFASGNNSYGLAVGDFDDDGNPDIAVTNSFTANSISILRNTTSGGAISFDNKITFPAGSNPYWGAISDLDGDGKIDLAVSNAGSNSLSVYKNNSTSGTISFSLKTDYKTATYPISVAIGDLDGDGLADILSSNASSNNVSIFKNICDKPATTITSFTPVAAGAGTTVNITGTLFIGATSVMFGNVPATSFKVVSPTSIDAVVSSGATGTVTVTTPNGTGTLSGFSFVPAPTITSFTPTSAAYNATVTITGTKFTGTTAVSFGGAPAISFNVVSSTSITAVVSSAASGSVTVTTPGGTATKTGFTFLPPSIGSFTPTSAGAGTTVTIYGSNFTGTTAVSIGGVPAASFRVVFPTNLQAVASSGASGSIVVTTPGGTASKTGFTFIPNPTITSFLPVAAAEGDTITIFGKYLIGATSVNFGGTAASSFTIVSDTAITAVVSTGKTGNVSVVTPGGTATFGAFTYTAPPTPTYCTPLYGTRPSADTSYIAGFKLTGEQNTSFNNNTGWGTSNSFSDYTANLSPVKMARGSAYAGSINSYSNYFDKVNGRGAYNTIWIDFNDNGLYDNSERLLNNLLIDTTNTDFSIFIPSSAQLGYHNMRVRNVHYNSLPDSLTPPCDYYATGETEEYRVQIIAIANTRAITPGVAGTCTPMTSTTINNSTNNANEWVPLLDEAGNLVAALNANGNNLGTVKTKVYLNNTATRKDATNNYYLDRNLQITPSIQPVTNVGVRIYLRASELTKLINTTGSRVSNISQLNLTKNTDNCSSFLSSKGSDFLQVGNGSGSATAGYYVEFSIPSFSSFYMNAGLKVLPIKLSEFKVQHVVNGNQLFWKCNNNSTTEKFEAEYSVDGSRFEKFNEIKANAQTIFSYSLIHYNIPNAQVLYYRLKITEKTGDVSYSEIKRIN
ncbi:MAG: cell surface receptor domain protein, partial [Segetibacter sp.]|nr:cell surface receptor domain protein [Segetibacter sp.]